MPPRKKSRVVPFSEYCALNTQALALEEGMPPSGERMTIDIHHKFGYKLLAQGGHVLICPNIIVKLAIWNTCKGLRETDIGMSLSKRAGFEMIEIVISAWLSWLLVHNSDLLVYHDG